jgi:hypothetical protein
MVEWCQTNNTSFNVNKTKELIVDFRRQQREHTPIHINRTRSEEGEKLHVPRHAHH